MTIAKNAPKHACAVWKLAGKWPDTKPVPLSKGTGLAENPDVFAFKQTAEDENWILSIFRPCRFPESEMGGRQKATF